MGSNETDCFRGTFDGAGYTLTFTANTTADYTAPFRYVNGANIRNLIVDGTITTSAQFAAGFIGYAKGDNSITNCLSSVTINSSVTGDGTHGGFIANIHNGTTDITGCAFNGSLLGSNTTNCGGFVGWTRTEYGYATIHINDCMYAPAAGENTVSTEGSYTFTRYSTSYNGNLPIILHSYYTQALGTTQGKQAHSITAGDYVTMEVVANDSTEYDVSGITLYPVGVKFNNVLYAGNEDVVSLNLSSEIPEGYTFNGYTVSNGGTISGDESPYTLTMPDADVTVTATATIEEPCEKILVDAAHPEVVVDDFEGYNINTENRWTGVTPGCWALVEEYTGAAMNQIGEQIDTLPQVYRGFNTTAGGSQSLVMRNRCVYAMLELGENVNINDLMMTFNLRQPKSIYRLQVGVVDEQGNFTLVKTLKSGTAMEEKTVSFANCPVSGRIAFRNTLVPGTGMSTSYLDYSYNYIDDINITMADEAKIDANVEDVNVDLDNITVYPNPTKGELYIDAVGIQKVECYNQKGQLVGVYDNANEISISEFINGVYMLRITVPQGVTMRKVVKK